MLLLCRWRIEPKPHNWTKSYRPLRSIFTNVEEACSIMCWKGISETELWACRLGKSTSVMIWCHLLYNLLSHFNFVFSYFLHRTIVDNLNYYPEGQELFSLTGCKRVAQKVGVYIADEKYKKFFQKTELWRCKRAWWLQLYYFVVC